jgi:hypothetical protein
MTLPVPSAWPISKADDYVFTRRLTGNIEPGKVVTFRENMASLHAASATPDITYASLLFSHFNKRERVS